MMPKREMLEIKLALLGGGGDPGSRAGEQESWLCPLLAVTLIDGPAGAGQESLPQLYG